MTKIMASFIRYYIITQPANAHTIGYIEDDSNGIDDHVPWMSQSEPPYKVIVYREDPEANCFMMYTVMTQTSLLRIVYIRLGKVREKSQQHS